MKGSFAFLLLAFSLFKYPDSSMNPVSLTLLPIHREFTEGEPIVFDLKIQNFEDTPINLDLGEDRKEGLAIRAENSNGSVQSKWRPHGGLWLVGTVRVPAKASFHEQVVLSDFGMTLPPGSYSLSLRLENAVKAEGRELKLPAASSSIIVTPRDRERLRQNCEAEAARYIGAADSQTAIDALNVLVNYKDPAAVACLITAYEGHSSYRLGDPLLRAIGNTHTTGGRSFLETIALSGDGESRAIAQAELTKH